MTRLILVILFFLLNTEVKSQYFSGTCDSLEKVLCPQSDFLENNKLVLDNILASDTFLIYTNRGGNGCQINKLISYYKSDGQNFYNKYNGTTLEIINTRNEVKATKRLINIFFENQLFKSQDTVATNHLFIDDGSSDCLIFKVGKYCSTYILGPEYNSSELEQWANKFILIN